MSKWIEKRTRPVLPAGCFPDSAALPAGKPGYHCGAQHCGVSGFFPLLPHAGAAGGTALRHRQREHRCHAERHCRQPGRAAQAE